MLRTCGASAPPIQTSTFGGPPTWLRCLTLSLRGADGRGPSSGRAPMVPEADRSLHQIGNYIREATDRKTTPPVVQGYHRVAASTACARAPGFRRGVIAGSASNRLPSYTIHRRTGDS